MDTGVAVGRDVTLRVVDRITHEIIDTAMGIHTSIGPGLLESVYARLLARLLTRRGLVVERQKTISMEYEGIFFENVCRADLVVEGTVVVEVKSVSQIAAVHSKQLLTYLRLLDLPVGLLINFNTARLKDGLKRVVNGYLRAE